jgi:hypothetical protein
LVSLSFSLPDYQSGLTKGRYAPPAALCPYYDVDPVMYRLHGTTDQRRGDLHQAVDELRKRTQRDYFDKTYPLQARTLDYSARSFPAYRFILPEVMTEDWLAIVDWGKFQRDHVLHQPLCGYVVLKLLDGDGASPPMTLPDGQTLLDACVDRILSWRGTSYVRDFLLSCGMSQRDELLTDSPIARAVWRVFFRETAYVAAVFHDLGYPWQYLERIGGNLHGMNTPAVKQNRNASQIVEVFGHRILFSVLQGYQAPDAACPSNWKDRITQMVDTALTSTHGFPGALGFLHLNDCIRKYPSQRQSPLHLLCVEWAAAAIMMHDMCKIYWGKSDVPDPTPQNPFLRLSFDRDPLSSIVTLTDVIQDFERPAAVFASGKKFVALRYAMGCSGAELQLDGRGLTIEYVMNNDESRAIKRKSLKKERRDYFDAQYGYLDMSSLGISNVQILVR